MTFYADLYNALRGRFETQIEVALSMPVLYDNAPPFGSDASPYSVQDPLTDTWVDLSVQPAGARQAETRGENAANFRTSGNLVAVCRGPLALGDAGMLSLVDAIVSAFRAVQTADFHLMVPSPSPGYRDGQWHRIDVVCPFTADDLT